MNPVFVVFLGYLFISERYYVNVSKESKTTFVEVGLGGVQARLY